MEYFWKENKKFVLLVGGALVFLVLYNSLVLSKLRSAAALAQSKRSQEKRSLEEKLRSGLPGDDALSLAKRDGDLVRKQMSAMAQESQFKISDRFRKKEKDSTKAFYDGLKEDLKDELQKKAVQGRLTIPPALGLPDDSAEDDAEELLLRLAVVERLVTLAVECGVEKIESIDTKRGSDEVRKGAFLRKTPVSLRFSGKPEAVMRMLHGAQKKGAYLAVLHFDALRPDVTRDVFEATMTVALLRMDEKAALASAEAHR